MTGTVFVVTSGKGGVGKTTTALNAGVALRGNGNSVAIVDADLGMANLGSMLGIERDVTLHDVLAGEAELEAAVNEEADGFGIVTTGRDLAGYATIDPERLPEVIRDLAEEYEYVVVDAGPGLHYESLLPLEAADEIVLVTTPSETAVGDTAKIAELAEMMDGDVRGVVLNRVTDEADPEAIAAAFDAEILGVIPEDPAVSESAEAGVPVERYAPDSPAAAAYRDLAAVLTEDADTATDAGHVPSDPSGGDEAETADTDTKAAAPTGAASTVAPAAEGQAATAESNHAGEATGSSSTGSTPGDDDPDAPNGESQSTSDDGDSQQSSDDGGSQRPSEEDDGGSGFFARLRGLF